MRTTDFLVVGSGVAGLSFALRAAEYGKVLIVTKANDVTEANTNYAQGGIASVTDPTDSFEKHIHDTMVAGDYLSKESVVRIVVEEAPERIKELVEWGIDFDKRPDGSFDLHKEGGHSDFRILHHKDNTGFEVERALVEACKKNPNIELVKHYFAVELITQHYLGQTVTRYDDNTECYGIYALNKDTGKVEKILSKITYLATGGIGNIYQVTTNPTIATGDGIAMVYRAKGVIDNMEFVQFHPTSLYHPGERPSYLITEAMRGFGAILKTQDGKTFMEKYDERGCLAPRDIVARAIDNEMKLRGDEYVYLDATGTNHEELKKHFPNIYAKCLSIGIDITKQPIPVVPAAHYLCGGIRVDEFGRTTIKHLYAGGETSCTGLHGANRLASNSLLEALVYAHRSALHSKDFLDKLTIRDDIPQWNDEGTVNNEENILITQSFKELQQIMTYYVGIVRSNLRMKRALDRLYILYNETEELYKRSKITVPLCELRNAINTAWLVIKMARRRRESVGLHYNIDTPRKK
ncbi:MAG: L-aspartate oxidase [Bacteroidales bacterium]|jgi:L-aspartate oxidase|nr:L-aspartate oxidase [Bacteroidales bacterium]MBQ5403480.1 L-aspartate oxidase [Bacteroidales bacterium]MBR6279229.1 L-aspartate oxidase [Bacteroidales bacterium]